MDASIESRKLCKGKVRSRRGSVKNEERMRGPRGRTNGQLHGRHPIRNPPAFEVSACNMMLFCLLEAGGG